MSNDESLCQLSKLNDELLTLIVIQLPIQKIFQLQSVCRAWKILFTDDCFLRQIFRVLCQTLVYPVSLYRDNAFAAYSVEINSWHRWTDELHSRYISMHDVHAKVGDWLLTDDESFGMNTEPPYRNLCLTNPREMLTKNLPMPQDLDYNWVPVAIGMSRGEKSDSWKVFIWNTESPEDSYPHLWEKVYWYNSKSDLWKTTRPWLAKDGEDIGNVMLHQGALHCTIDKLDEGFNCCISRKICRYSEKQSCWEELSAQISGVLLYRALLEWQGRLMVIGGRAAQHNTLRVVSVHVWQLDEKENAWVEMGRMPHYILDHLRSFENFVQNCQFYFSTCGHHIFVTSSLFEPSESRHAMYDLLKSSWCKIPEPPFSKKWLTFSRFTPNFGF